MSSFLQMEISRVWLVVLLFVAAGSWLVWDSDAVYAYRHYSDAKEHLYLDFNDLSDLTPEQTRAAYPVNLYCGSQQVEHLGDFICASWLQGWNDIRAMNSVFFYANGRLLQAKVDVPRWHHDELIAYLMRKYGEPSGYYTRVQWRQVLTAAVVTAATKGKVPMMSKVSDELGVWKLESGAWLMVNMEKEINPLQWSTALWMSPQKVEALVGTAQQ